MCVRACVRACTCVRARACVRLSVCVFVRFVHHQFAASHSRQPCRVWRTRGPSAAPHRDHGALAGVQDTQGLVLAGGQDLGAVPVPAGAVDEVGVHGVHPHHLLSAGHVPQDQYVVAACRGQ